MKDYLTLKQTVQYIERTENTIRRVLVRKRESINKKEGYEVIKYVDNKYYISISYLRTRYNVDTKKDITSVEKKEDTEELRELRELRETIKMYSIMLEANANEIEGLKEEKEYLKTQNNKIMTLFDQSQKLIALEKNITFKPT